MTNAYLANDCPIASRRSAWRSNHFKKISGIAVEFTYNWYWLVGGLQEKGYKMHLANPSAIQQYEGLKHTDDKWDSFWLSHMLTLGILPQGYIYPKKLRPRPGGTH
jgi:hypothetical protein